MVENLFAATVTAPNLFVATVTAPNGRVQRTFLVEAEDAPDADKKMRALSDKESQEEAGAIILPKSKLFISPVELENDVMEV